MFNGLGYCSNYEKWDLEFGPSIFGGVFLTMEKRFEGASMIFMMGPSKSHANLPPPLPLLLMLLIIIIIHAIAYAMPIMQSIMPIYGQPYTMSDNNHYVTY